MLGSRARALAVLGALLLAGAVRGEPVAAQGELDRARGAALEWLALVDAGEYRRSWEAAAASFQQAVTPEQWELAATQARASLGPLRSRTPAGAEIRRDIPGAPPGEYAILRFASTFAQGPAEERLVLVRQGDAWRAVGYFAVPGARADYSAPAGAPYTAEEVTVRSGEIDLAGTLTLPGEARGPVPAVVLISGSGPQDRDQAIPPIPGYRPFRQFADTLSRRGIAVLRLDERGVGGSGGEFRGSTLEDFAGDVRAAVAFLRARPEIDADRIALLGHSEGGIVAPMVAAEDRRVAAVALLAAPAWTGRRVSDFQLREAWERMGLSPAQMDSARAANDPLRESLAESDPAIRFFLDHDPLSAARRLSAPVLVLQGATDRQVTPEQAEELAGAIRSAGNAAVTVRIVPGVNHLFLPDPEGTADPARYARLPTKEVPDEVLGILAEWLVDHLSAPR